MKTLAFMLLLLIVTSCSITSETNVTCWKQRLCVGDTYVYNHAPRIGGGHYVTEVQIITLKANQCLIRHANGRETWVSCAYFEDYATPMHVHRQPNKKEKKDHKRKY